MFSDVFIALGKHWSVLHDIYKYLPIRLSLLFLCLKQTLCTSVNNFFVNIPSFISSLIYWTNICCVKGSETLCSTDLKYKDELYNHYSPGAGKTLGFEEIPDDILFNYFPLLRCFPWAILSATGLHLQIASRFDFCPWTLCMYKGKKIQG